MRRKTTRRRAALAGFAFGALGLFGGLAQSGSAADLATLPPNVRTAVLKALRSGDYVTASRLVKNVPLIREAPLARAIVQDTPPPPDTTWEDLKACGFYPQQTRLECIVEIKIPVERVIRSDDVSVTPEGFNGPLDGFGSQENVEFCVDMIPMDFGGGPIWMDVGRGTVIVHDQRPAAWANHPVTGPWNYAVYRDFDPIAGPRIPLQFPSQTTVVTQSQAFTYRVMAILRWEPPWGLAGAAPLGCSTTPRYGDIATFLVRGDPPR